MIRDKEIPEYGLRNTEVLAYLKELGHHDIQQSSVTAGLSYLPKLLDKNGIPSIFDYDGMHFYLLDNYMKFVLKWVPELIDDLFNSENDYDANISVRNDYDMNNISLNIEKILESIESLDKVREYNPYVNVFTHMTITYEDSKAKIAEVQHPVYGKRNISENDRELIKIIDELKLNDVVLSMGTDTLFGFESFDIMFYLGFLYAKDHIYYKYVDRKSIRIYLTSEAKKRLNMS